MILLGVFIIGAILNAIQKPQFARWEKEAQERQRISKNGYAGNHPYRAARYEQEAYKRLARENH